MSYPKIPIIGYWRNPIQSTPKFTKLEFGKGGVIERQRSQLLNAVRRNYAVQGTITNKDELETFLRSRDGRPFEYHPDDQASIGNFTCTTWDFTWLVLVNTGDTLYGVWTFNATFTEDLNPIAE